MGKIIKKYIALLLIIVLIFGTNTTFANVVFDKATFIPSGNGITNLTEDKVNKFNQYLFQNRNEGKTSTLIENGNDNILELDNIYKSPYNLTNSGVTNYNFSYGKAIYDGNIAIVDLATTSSGRYTYEAPYYCDLLIGNLAKYVKVGNNICLSSYEQFKTEYDKNPNRSYVNVIKTNEFATADLSKYSIIIFPDIILGKHSEILDELNSTGITNIKNYVTNGGITYFSSKSLILSDKMELTNKIVDENTLIKNHSNQGKISLEKNDYNSQVLNFGFYKGTSYATSNTGTYYDYLLGSYLVNKNNDPSIVPIRYFDIKNDKNYYFQDLISSEDVEIDAPNSIEAFYKPTGKGYVIYNGGSSLFSPQTQSHKLFLNHTLNSILFSFLRDVYTTATISQKSNPDLVAKLIPALEKDITFEYKYSATNVFNQKIYAVQTIIDYSTGGLEISGDLPAGCSIAPSNKYEIICSKDSLEPSEKYDISFKLKVIEPNFSKAGTNIAVTSTKLEYINSSNVYVSQNIGAQTVDSVESANIRSSLNLDPYGYYPLPGKGVYVDQVVNAENKGPTESIDTVYTSIVPLISPIFEESDQAKLVSKLVFAKDYHNSLYNSGTKTNYYPFTNSGDCAVTNLVLPDRCKDFVVPNLLPKNYVYVDNYDEPIYKESSNDTEASTQINQDFASNDLGKGIIKQSFLPDADKLFMHAKARKMVRQYPTQRELLFARQDIYFYENPAFPLPKGITDKSQYISIDKSNLGCTKIPGSYGYPTGVVAGKYPNELECNKVSWINNKIDYDSLPAGIEKTDYLFPVDPKNNITDFGDLAGFNSNGDYVGVVDEEGNKSEKYPIKLINGSYASFYLPARSTTKGGIIEFNLPDGDTPDQVYVLADHIAINKIEKNGTNVKIYFYRGKMPNEQTLKSIVGIGLEGVNKDISNIEFKISSLNYDLSSTEINTYIPEQSINANFAKYVFMKSPAVKLKFELPRRKRINENLISNLLLNQAQTDLLFTRPNYYATSLVFKKNTLSEITALINQAKVTTNTKDELINLFNTTPTESFVNRYENLEPFVRFGAYIQELAFHRTVWGVAEDHPINDPGIMADTAMFGNVGVVGIGPIPFKEYLTTGKFQLIPMAQENSRIEYKDIFSRTFASPIRTVLPEAVPLPPPVRDFVINTTYEMYDKNGTPKQSWNTEDELEIRQNVKLYNNYPKFFDPTLCLDNKGNTLHYGQCYDGTGTNITGYNGETEYKLQDKTLDNIDFYRTNKVRLFNTKLEYTNFMDTLNAMLSASGMSNYSVTTLNKAQNNKGSVVLQPGEKIDDKARNYSPEVEKFYPSDYIKNLMWNLTHYDYDDSVYAKGYPYHMDNQIPNPSSLDFWNPAKELPHNIITIPTFKGVGYNLKYFKENLGYTQYEINNNGKIEHGVTPYTSRKYPDKTGWWSENLQNKDETLLAGQESVNKIPYEYKGNGEYLKADLINSSDFEKQTTNNIYSCLFNPGLLKDKQDKFQYKANVVLNNVIPIIPWIQKENENAGFLNSFSCNNSNITYDNSNLYKVNNIVETENAYWSYFGANLRGGSKESLNMINRLSPMAGVNFEGDLKIIEGGRFVYWNPAFGPNAFQISDNNVSVIKAVKSDITVDKELIPYTLKNYKTDAYLVYTVKDPTELFVDANGKETARKWPNDVYIDSRGGGNFASSVYVGSSYNGAATKSLLDPGEKTLIRLDLYNNSGYDWDLLGSGETVLDNGQYVTHISGGIDFDIVGQASLNATDLMNKVARNVLHPKKFNFINLEIPEEIKDYVTVVPSDANIMTPGTFFDFDFVNVTTIRDGFKGSYFMDLQVSSNIPDNLKSKVYAIKATLNPEYFNHIPGVAGKDPVNWPNKLELPDFKFGVADNENNAYYINGQSSNIKLDVNYNSGFTFDKAYEINEEGLNELRLRAGDGTNKHKRLRETFENITSSGFAIREILADNTESKLSLDFDKSGITKFPYVNASGSIVPKTYVLVHLKKDNLADGETVIENSSSISFDNDSKISKTKENTTMIKGYAGGPKLEIKYNGSLIGSTPGDKLQVQKLVEGENTIELKLFLKNSGTDVAFDPSIKVQVAPGVEINNLLTTGATINGNEITINKFLSESGAIAEGEAVGPGITNYFPIYLTYSGSYSDIPVSLIDNASFEFTPFDKGLPALVGTYSTGFSLDFVKTSLTYSTGANDNLGLVFSGNTAGIYWDLVENNSNILTKTYSTGSEIFTKNIELDPTIDHNLTAISYFKTRAGNYKEIANIPLNIAKQDPFITIEKTQNMNGKDIIVSLKSNKLGKYNGTFKVTSSAGSYDTGAILVSNSGTMNYIISDVDLAKSTDIDIKLFNSGSEIASTNTQVAGEGNRLFNLKALKTRDDSIKVYFQTNRVLNNCYRIKRNGVQVTTGCNTIGSQYKDFNDLSVDAFKDYIYTVDIYDTNTNELVISSNVIYTTPEINATSIPLKIIDSDVVGDIEFAKYKDLTQNFIVENTPIRYVAKVKTAGQENFKQVSSDSNVTVTYASGETVYGSESWDKIISNPTYTDNGNYKLIEVGDNSGSLVFDSINIITVNNIWSKPKYINMEHNSGTYKIAECGTKYIDTCYIYDTNKVKIYTKKFSKFYIYKRTGGSHSSDNCPLGDFSPSNYDNSCGIDPNSLVVTGTGLTITGSLTNTGIINNTGSLVNSGMTNSGVTNTGVTITNKKITKLMNKNSLTRAEFIKIVMDSFKINSDINYSKSFDDVDQFTDYNQYISSAKTAGLISGQKVKGKTIFRPNDKISRIEALSILMKIKQIDLKSDKKLVFKDKKVKSWMKPYMIKGYELGIINGYKIKKELLFKPNDAISKKDAVKIIKKVLE